jgi:hypothetical protein
LPAFAASVVGGEFSILPAFLDLILKRVWHPAIAPGPTSHPRSEGLLTEDRGKRGTGTTDSAKSDRYVGTGIDVGLIPLKVSARIDRSYLPIGPVNGPAIDKGVTGKCDAMRHRKVVGANL